MLIRISNGIVDIGHSGGEDASVGDSSTGMERDEKEAMSSDIVVAGSPSGEWWAGLGMVTAAFDGLGSAVLDLKNEGGKCLFL